MALDLKDTAKRLIRNLAAKSEYGVFYIVYETGGSKDPNTGQWTPGTEVRAPIDAARVSYSQSLIDGVNIRTGDYKLILPYDTPFPTGGEQYWFESEGFKYTPVIDGEIDHAGTPQIYTPQVRRS